MTIKFYDRRDAGKYLADKLKLYIKTQVEIKKKKLSVD